MSNNEGPESRQSSRWKYSLRTLLLIVVIICLAIPLVLQSFELRRVEAELRQLRIETGQLTVDDPTKVHVVAVETDEPNNWRWRMFLPKGVRYTWCLGYGDIPAQGVPQPKIESSSNEQYSETQAEVLIDASLRQLEDGRWVIEGVVEDRRPGRPDERDAAHHSRSRYALDSRSAEFARQCSWKSGNRGIRSRWSNRIADEAVK